MDVNELLSRILEVSHDEVAPDTALQNKALRWLNSAYHELMEIVLPFMESRLKKEVELPIVNGEVMLPGDVNRILSFDIDGVNLYEFNQYVNGNKLILPINFKGAVISTVSYMPRIDNLLDDDAEDRILLPRQFHAYLVWGGLVWASVYERGFNNASDLKLFQMKWDEAKRETKLSLSSSIRLKSRYEDIV